MYRQLQNRFDAYGLTKTRITDLKSVATVTKALFKEMNVRPWDREDFPPETIGAIMSTQFGGRCEVRRRRTLDLVRYYDFRSMYLSIRVLIGAWRDVIAESLVAEVATDEVRHLLAHICLDDLPRPETWESLNAIVQIEPDGDLLPARARYGPDLQGVPPAPRTTGLHPISFPDGTLWFALPDLVYSVLATGKVPRVVRALRLVPYGIQPDLHPIDLLGDPNFHFDPSSDDFYEALIRLREQLKLQRDDARARGHEERYREIKAKLGGLKPMSNAATHGVPLETGVQPASERTRVLVYSGGRPGKPEGVEKVERYGRYFNPFLSTFITSAGRLMLGLAELQIERRGLTWAFCDTDSLAPATSDPNQVRDLIGKCEEVQAWFEPLNPAPEYGPFLALKEENKVGPDDHRGLRKPLYCIAISSKQHVLFHMSDDGRPEIRKATAHGLGNYLPPYPDEDAPSDIPPPRPDLEVDRWVHDVWYRIIEAFLADCPDQALYADLPGFDKPVVSIAGLNTPQANEWFPDRDEPDRLPFSRALAFQANMDEQGQHPTPITLYDPDFENAARSTRDRLTGEPVDRTRLKTYADVLGPFHVRPEYKVERGRPLDSGTTQRRPISVEGVDRIGKESNMYDEDQPWGYDPADDPQYSPAPDDTELLLARARAARDELGLNRVAKIAKIHPTKLSRMLNGKQAPVHAVLRRFLGAAENVRVQRRAAEQQEEDLVTLLRQAVDDSDVTHVAARLGIARTTISEVLCGTRRPSGKVLRVLRDSLAR